MDTRSTRLASEPRMRAAQQPPSRLLRTTSITAAHIEAAMARLPEEDHRLLVWLCTGQTAAR